MHCMCAPTNNVFGEANAEVMRNSLPLCPCMKRGKEEVAWWGGESLRSRRRFATLSY